MPQEKFRVQDSTSKFLQVPTAVGTPTFDGRYLGTLDIKGLQDLLYLRYPGTHTFDLERGTWGTQVPLLSISELSKEGPQSKSTQS